METTYQDLHKEGIGVEIKHAPIISGDEEVILWERKILGCHSPTALVRAVFFPEWKVSEVAKNTVISSFHNFSERMTTGSTRSMGLRIFVEVLLTYVERMWFRQFVCPTAGDRCHVRLLDLYVSKLPNVFIGPIMTSGTFQSSSTSFGLSQADIENFSKF